MDILNNIKSFYTKNKSVVLNKAIVSLREEIATNPNNINATQLLADMLLEQGEIAEARDILEKLYQLQPQAAQSRLIKTLLILAKQTDNENEQIKVYQQIFKLDAKQQEAINAWQKIWQQRGDDARKAGDLETALAHYRTATHFEQDVKTPIKKPIRRNPKAAVKPPPPISPAVELKTLIEKQEQALNESRQQVETLQQQLTSVKEELTTKTKQEDILKQRLENEQNALATVKEELTSKTKQENILKQRLDNEKNALANIETLTKDQEKRVEKYQQEIAGLKHELIIKEQTLINLRETLKNYGQREKELTKLINEKENETIAAKSEPQNNNNVLIILGSIIVTITIIIMGLILWQFSIKNDNTSKPVTTVIEPVKTPTTPTIIPPPAKEPVKITVVKPPIVSQTLCVHFKKRSWIRISDDNNKKLYEGIRKAGEILALEGKPPFNMNVGNVDGVYVEYDCDINQVSAYPTQEGKKNVFIIGDE